MPNLILAQTQVAADCGAIVGCSGATLVTTPQAREATKNGTPGGIELTVTVTKAVAAFAGVMFQSADNEPGKATWDAGDWLIRLNVTTSNEAVTWVGTYVCRFDNACGSLAVVGSLTGQSISLSTTGVKQMTVAGAEQSANLSDEIYIVLLFSNSNAHQDKTFGFTPDQDIDTPVVVAAEYVYAGDVPMVILPDEPQALLSKSYAGAISLAMLPDAPTAPLEKSYGGDIPLVALPDFPKAILDKSYAGDVGLVLMPNSIYELISGAGEFVYAGDIPLTALPSYTSILDRVYQGTVALNILPDLPKALLEKAYMGAVALVLMPNSIYSLEEELLEFAYNGNIPLFILPSYSSILERIYKGDIAVLLAPSSICLLEEQVDVSLRAKRPGMIYTKKPSSFYSKNPRSATTKSMRKG